jgi:hypothetical protein
VLNDLRRTPPPSALAVPQQSRHRSAQHRCSGQNLRGRRPDRRAGRSPATDAPYPAPQLCHPAAGERRRYPHRPGSARS